jgi:hypothetical protein
MAFWFVISLSDGDDVAGVCGRVLIFSFEILEESRNGN